MPVDYRAEGPIAHITINNGELNLLSPVELQGLYEAVVAMLADPNVRAGVLSGQGRRAFSAGGDLRYPEPPAGPDPAAAALGDMTPRRRSSGSGPDWEYDSDLQALERYKPIVAAVHGWCLGAGLVQLLQITDIRVCSPDARFGLPEIAYGMGGAGGMTRIGRQIPHTVAMKLTLTGEPIDADEARACFLVNEVVPADHVVERAVAIAAKIAEQPPLAVRVEMEAYAKGMDLDRLGALRYGERLYQLQRLAVGESDVESFNAARSRTRGSEEEDR
jgi:enoyl-CoA hydratase/carnithine racemase